MKIKQKFILLAGLLGAVMLIVSAIGYNTASNAVEDAARKELLANILSKSDEAESWLASKAQYAKSMAATFSQIKDDAMTKRPEMLAGILADKEFQDAYHVRDDGWAWALISGDLNGKREWRERPWYIQIKKTGQFEYTDPYVDAMTGKLVVSATMPYSRENGVGGGLCLDIKMDAIQDHVGLIKFNGEGVGYILNPKSDTINVSADTNQNLKKLSDSALFRNHITEMTQKKSGIFSEVVDGKEKVVAYSTMGLTGWITAIELPPLNSFGALAHLRYIYFGLTAVGVILLCVSLLFFANGVVCRLSALNQNLHAMADGDLSGEPMVADSSDEFGEMADEYNRMKQSITSLVEKITNSANQVSSSSQSLADSSHQSAENATHVAQTVVSVSEGMNKQVESVRSAKESIDATFVNIDAMANKTIAVAENARQMEEAAELGSNLMQDTISKMVGVEQSVGAAAAVVRKLGENSQEIGQVVETISHISQQTNLLALNAAIEAAQAGEAGRGFSVVADEVRKLAEQSSVAAGNIAKMIADVQRDTSEAVDSMENGTAEMAKGLDSVRTVAKQFGEIANRVSSVNQEMEDIRNSADTVDKGMRDVVSAIDDIDAVSRDVSQNTQTISASAEEQSASSEEIAAASQSLSSLAEELKGATAAFKV